MAETPDLSGIISKLTEDPETLGRVMNLASSLMGNIPTDNKEAPPAENTAAPQTEGQIPAFDPAMLASVLGSLGSPGGKPADGNKENANKSGDSRTALLLALKPYMSPERAEKVDMMIKAMKLADIAGGLLGNSDLLK